MKTLSQTAKKIIAKRETEAQIEARCVAMAHQHGYQCLKMDGTGQTHMPDRLLINPAWEPFFVEFKRPGGVLSAGQKMCFTALIDQEYPVYLVTSSEVFFEILTNRYNSPVAKAARL